MRRLLADRRIRYVLVGGLSAGFYYSAFSAIWLTGRVPYLLVAVIANLVTALVIYPVNRLVVFRTGGPWLTGFLRFYVVSLWALMFSLGGLPLLVEVAHLHVLLAQAIVIVVSALTNYQISRRWVFRHRSPRLDDERTGHDVRLGVPGQDEVQQLQR
jgi:putative flippase GtrA